MVTRMQGTRFRKKETRVKMRGVILEMWGMQEIRVRIWGIRVGMQGIRLKIRGNWGKNTGV